MHAKHRRQAPLLFIFPPFFVPFLAKSLPSRQHMKLLSLALLVSLVSADTFYTPKDDVIQLNAYNFKDVVFNSNYSSVVEFYAPWCGHCQNLKNPFKKAAAVSKDYLQVAAIDCDAAENKKLCSDYRIQGFPTIMVFRPPKFDPTSSTNRRSGAHANEVYSGARDTKSIVEFGVSRIKNYVKRVSPNNINQTLGNSEKTQLLLVTDKAKPSALIKSIALDFLNDIESFYYPFNDKTKKALTTRLEEYQQSFSGESITSPSILVLHENEIHIFDGKLDKLSISKFLAEFSTPLEGPLSKRGKFLEHIRRGIKPGRKAKKGKKGKQTKNHDEL